MARFVFERTKELNTKIVENRVEDIHTEIALLVKSIAEVVDEVKRYFDL